MRKCFEFYHLKKAQKKPVLRIRDILVRIWIRVSVSLTNGSGFGSGSGSGSSRFFAYYFFRLHLPHFSKTKSHNIKKSQNSRNQGFSYYCCLMIEGSGSVPRTVTTNGSGSGRPKNIRIRNKQTIIKLPESRLILQEG
jgi:hypothetical protein